MDLLEEVVFINHKKWGGGGGSSAAGPGSFLYLLATAMLSLRGFPLSTVPWHSSMAFFCSSSSPNLTKP